jgi:L-fuculose-phosphate aldolase
MEEFLPQRRQLIAACLELAAQGYLAGTGGNLALRLDAQHIAVTPSAADYYSLEPADIAVLNLATLEQVAGHLPPSVETGLHATMLRAAPQLNASVHTHQPLASAVSLIGRPLPLRAAADIAALGPELAVIGYAPSGTRLLVRALRRQLRPQLHAYLLRNHGVICRAATLSAAVHLLGRIELAAGAFLRERARVLLAREHPLRALALAALPESVP